jgi:choline-sulfatase
VADTTRPSILLVTLDTTRADAIGVGTNQAHTDVLNTIAASGRVFRQAYATVPETLPAHASFMTGLYPAGHTVHENARYVPASLPLLAEQLQKAGYRTAAFVSAFVLDRRFGLARGFDVYDDGEGRWTERNARDTTDAVLAELRQPSGKPRFIWVHYYDPHAPYSAPVPGGSEGTVRQRYLQEVRFVDEQLARLTSPFHEAAKGSVATIVVGDHGEGLGDHGEAEHGHLLFQSTMHVPLIIAGPGVAAGTSSDVPVSTRRVYHTVLDWAGLGAEHSLRGAVSQRASTASDEAVVLGEAMKPFLEYGWQPQVMAVAGRFKSILAGRVETFDLVADPGEARNLGSAADVPPGMRKALDDYPIATADAARSTVNLDEDAKRRLASLGYVSAGAAPIVRKDAPRPVDMTALLPLIEQASARFTAADYGGAIPLLDQIIARDPNNLDARLRLATSYSSLGANGKAEDAFRRAAAIAPTSQDVRTYLALHYARTIDWQRAVPMLEQVVRETPDRVTAAEALAALKTREGEAAMDREDTGAAIAAFERARQLAPATFKIDLELGVLYLSARRFPDARAALDRALTAKPDDPMALFKRAQVSVLLGEGDAERRIAVARQKADATTTRLLERERLFRSR